MHITVMRILIGVVSLYLTWSAARVEPKRASVRANGKNFMVAF